MSFSVRTRSLYPRARGYYGVEPGRSDAHTQRTLRGAFVDVVRDGVPDPRCGRRRLERAAQPASRCRRAGYRGDRTPGGGAAGAVGQSRRRGGGVGRGPAVRYVPGHWAQVRTTQRKAGAPRGPRTAAVAHRPIQVDGARRRGGRGRRFEHRPDVTFLHDLPHDATGLDHAVLFWMSTPAARRRYATPSPGTPPSPPDGCWSPQPAAAPPNTPPRQSGRPSGQTAPGASGCPTSQRHPRSSLGRVGARGSPLSEGTPPDAPQHPTAQQHPRPGPARSARRPSDPRRTQPAPAQVHPHHPPARRLPRHPYPG